MSALMEHPALVALGVRAGASDTDRALWLAERLRGVTATEIRDLVVKGPTFRRELIDIKLGRTVDTFTGNQYTAWGKKRESVIAEWVERLFGIAPESRVIRAADNLRLLASPDGVGVDFDGLLLLSEIKTSGHDIAPTTQKYKDVGYLLQMIWGMRITGARRCLYVWEQHDGNWQDRGADYLEPAPLNAQPLTQWIEYDEVLAVRLEAIALDFLDEVDEARRAMDAGEAPAYDDELDTLAVNYLRFLGEEKSAGVAKKGAFDGLKAKLADRATFSQASPLARITWTRGGTVEEPSTATETTVNEAAAREAHPAKFAALDKVTVSVERAQGALARALSRLDKAQTAVDGVLEHYTETSLPTGAMTTKTVRENLTVTEVKAPKEKKA